MGHSDSGPEMPVRETFMPVIFDHVMMWWWVMMMDDANEASYGSLTLTQRRFFLCFDDLSRDLDLFFRRLLQLRSSSELDRDRFRRFRLDDFGGDRDRELLELRRDRFDFFDDLRLLREEEERYLSSLSSPSESSSESDRRRLREGVRLEDTGVSGVVGAAAAAAAETTVGLALARMSFLR